MARILKKIPDFKLPKYKMKEVGDLEELRMEYAEKNIEDMKKRMERHHAQENYPGTHYRTVKEFSCVQPSSTRSVRSSCRPSTKRKAFERSHTDSSGAMSMILGQR